MPIIQGRQTPAGDPDHIDHGRGRGRNQIDQWQGRQQPQQQEDIQVIVDVVGLGDQGKGRQQRQADKDGRTFAPGRRIRPAHDGISGQALPRQQRQQRDHGPQRARDRMPVMRQQQHDPQPDQQCAQHPEDQQERVAAGTFLRIMMANPFSGCGINHFALNQFTEFLKDSGASAHGSSLIEYKPVNPAGMFPKVRSIYYQIEIYATVRNRS